jgi:L-fuconolactonase
MPKIDSHQHFWKFDPVRNSWINDSMYILQRDFLPEDIAPILNHYGIDGCISVQVDQSEEENTFMLQQADENQFIKGVVGWVDLCADDIDDKLAYYSQFKKLKGFRHILQGEKNRAFMLKQEFKKGISMLEKWGFTYDILVYTDQLAYIHEFVRFFPNQPFIIDHIAKPQIKARQIKDWEKQMQAIAKHENVYCKVSGMVTEADWMGWKKNDFKPYLDVVFEAFGSERVMYGSDWPVCKLAATYGKVIGIADEYISSFSQSEKDSFWGNNAHRFYKL